MIQQLRNVLQPDELAQLRSFAAQAQFIDGRITNPNHPVKQNLQVAQSDPGQCATILVDTRRPVSSSGHARLRLPQMHGYANDLPI
jgi:predicted 2-oxoglutarate/Fe(II)-dependent dioxygenase YbiX